MVSHLSESAAMSVYVASRHTGLVGQGRHCGGCLQSSSSPRLFQKGEKNNPEYFLWPEEMQLGGHRTVSGLRKLEGVDLTPRHFWEFQLLMVTKLSFVVSVNDQTTNYCCFVWWGKMSDMWGHTPAVPFQCKDVQMYVYLFCFFLKWALLWTLFSGLMDSFVWSASNDKQGLFGQKVCSCCIHIFTKWIPFTQSLALEKLTPLLLAATHC